MLLPIAILLLSLIEIEESAPIDYLSTETVAPFLLLISELGTTAEFTPCGDVDGDQRVGLFLNGMESAAIAIDGNPFQIVDADEKGLGDRHATLQIQTEHRLGVITDGVEGAAVVVQGQAGGFVQSSRLVENSVFADQAEAEQVESEQADCHS